MNPTAVGRVHTCLQSGGKQDQYKNNPQRKELDAMEVSRLALSPELQKQTSTKTKILKWIQDHPNRSKNTNIAKLSREMQITGTTYDTKHIALNQMVNNQMISRFGNKFNSNFIINYLHKDLPQEILENAPAHEKENIRIIKAEAEKNKQELTTEGIRVSKIETQPNSTQETKTKTGETDGKSKPQPQIEVSKKEKQISITININLKD